MTEFQKVYDCLGIHILERGESYYQDMMTEVVKEFEKKGEWKGDATGAVSVSRFHLCIYEITDADVNIFLYNK